MGLVIIKDQKWQRRPSKHFGNRRICLGAMTAVIRWQFKQLNSYLTWMEFQCFHEQPANWNLLLLLMSGTQDCLWPIACLCFLPCPAFLLYGLRCWHIHTLTRTHTFSEFRHWAISIPKPTEVFYASFSSILKMLTRGKSKILHPKPSPCWWGWGWGVWRDPVVGGTAVLCQPFMVCLWQISIKPNSYRPTIKKKKNVETKRFMPAAENLSRHVGNMSMTS